ncbi:PDR/VanB family oxidoreductase [Pokkaliibacter sp. MBI-7]|uniref:PDR/VanB family oxidoreductase n=1 Tax=Pokkaliibacter sp. MBI-7 TaxID=3040600 RepID=UPI00244B61EF|nr:PDR/VanB family oxidoreductase [Pokkaliibacter sp. MBI-7]MDH2434593.1 PDR/VanB family oxidoreductase [Pokkaliibacter sp. MBI-7]
MIDVRVSLCADEAADIRRFQLEPINSTALPAFTAGAHIDVHLPNGLIRQYSLCNADSEYHRYVIGVLNDPASRGGSKAMHELINQGDVIRISEPRNLFPLAGQGKRHLLFAGGIGITPLLSMAEHLHRHDQPFELHYCARSSERMAFRQQLQEADFASRVYLHFDDGDAQQRLDAARLLATPDTDTHLYVCGPGGFMEHVLSTARQQGWLESQLHREYFAATPVDHDADGSFEVELQSSGVVYQIPAEHSIVQVLEAAGVDVAVSCEQGICGTCLTRVLSGEPDHRDMFMTDEEHAANDQMTICCSRSRSSRLVLDL